MSDRNLLPLRIAVTIPYDLAVEGGVKRHAMNLAGALRRLGDEVDVIGPCSNPQALENGMYGFPGVVALHSNGSTAHIGAFVSPLRIRRFFQQRHYDVLHLHEPLVPSINYFARWSVQHTATVCTFHSFSELPDSPSQRLLRYWSRAVFPFMDHGIAVSAAAESQARRLWHRPLCQIPNGVPTSIFTPSEIGKDFRVPTESAPLRLLFVGNWSSERKGLPILLQAFELLQAQGLALQLAVIGSGNKGQQPIPGVNYLGPISDQAELAKHYQSCDLFIAPSTGQESFGIVLLEAMACGSPVVCADIEGYRCVVRDEPSTAGAVLFPPGDATALAAAITRLAADPQRRRTMGQENRQHALAYDWDQIALRVRKEYVAAIISRRDGRRKSPEAAASTP